MLQPGPLQPQTVAGIAGVVVVWLASGIKVGGTKAVNRAMGEHQPGLVFRQLSPVEAVEPAAGIACISATQ